MKKQFHLLGATYYNKPVVTRSGKEVTQLKYFYDVESEYVVYGVVNKRIYTWTIDGHFDNKTYSDMDLFMYEQPTELED